jgi:hypothetical protein
MSARKPDVKPIWRRALQYALVYVVLHLHDFWIWICDTSHELYCQFLCGFARVLARHPRKLLYAYLDPTRAPSEFKVRCVPADITPLVSTYYAVDTILSCYTMQEWLKRFNIKADYVNLIYVKNSEIRYSRIDLNNDVETTTGDVTYMDMNEMPGRIIHNLDNIPAKQ